MILFRIKNDSGGKGGDQERRTSIGSYLELHVGVLRLSLSLRRVGWSSRETT